MKGILFLPELVDSIINGSKTQTRRVMKPQPVLVDGIWRWTPRQGVDLNMEHLNASLIAKYAKYQPGVVYLKEAWHHLNIEVNKATSYDFGIEYSNGEIRWWTDNAGEMNYPLDEKKHSPMFMPEKYARAFLTILDVRPERVKSIAINDCIAEGLVELPDARLDDESRRPWCHVALPDGHWMESDARHCYQTLWDSINPDYPWDSNPFVWRYSFIRCDREGKAIGVKYV